MGSIRYNFYVLLVCCVPCCRCHCCFHDYNRWQPEAPKLKRLKSVQIICLIHFCHCFLPPRCSSCSSLFLLLRPLLFLLSALYPLAPLFLDKFQCISSCFQTLYVAEDQFQPLYSHLSLLSTQITGMYHRAWFMWCWGWNADIVYARYKHYANWAIPSVFYFL